MTAEPEGEARRNDSDDGVRSEPAETAAEKYRQQAIKSIGGWQGALITALPTTVFVIVNVVTTLRPAIFAAVGTALALALYRLVRKQSVQQALSGLVGVVVAALIAARTGEARGYFLLGIWTSFAYAVPFAISVFVRRPLIGLLWEFLDPTPAAKHVPWHRLRPLLLAYTWATTAAVVVFLARGFVQWHLYGTNATGWLAFARIAMGYPLFIAAVGFAFFMVRRARHRLAGTAPEAGAA